MKIRDLINSLENLASEHGEELEVCTLDVWKNLHNDGGDGEGCISGIEQDFEVFLMDEDAIPEGAKPWVAISHENSDYTDDGAFQGPMP